MGASFSRPFENSSSFSEIREIHITARATESVGFSSGECAAREHAPLFASVCAWHRIASAIGAAIGTRRRRHLRAAYSASVAEEARRLFENRPGTAWRAALTQDAPPGPSPSHAHRRQTRPRSFSPCRAAPNRARWERGRRAVPYAGGYDARTGGCSRPSSLRTASWKSAWSELRT